MMRFVSFAAAGLIGIILFGCVVFVFGSMVEGYGEYHDQHEACLRLATNGYDIQRCR